MKKSIIKMLSVILVAVLTLTSAPLSGLVGLDLPEWLNFSIMSKAATTSGTCGNNLTWTYSTSTYTLTISGTGEMYNYLYSYCPWKDYRNDIKKVVITQGVTTIGEDVFRGNTNLESITIADSVVSVYEYAFYGCTSLKNIIIPNNVKLIDEYAFYNCTALESITIGSGITSIESNAFYGCTNLQTLYYIGTVDNWIEISFKYNSNPMQYAKNEYFNNELITDVILSEGLTKINDYAFVGSNMTSIIIPDTVTSIGYNAFYNCTNLIYITVDSNNQFYSTDEYGVLFNKDKTELIQYPICNSRESYIIPNGVTSIWSNSFFNCFKLKKITISDSVKSIGYSTFSECKNITNISLPDNIISIGNLAFRNCSSLTSITIPDSVTIIGDSAFSGCTSLTNITIPDSVTIIGDSVFSGCTSLTNITIPDSVTAIGDYAFYNCSSLTSVTIGDGVASIGDSAFENCKSLENITIGNNVSYIKCNAFNNTAYYNDANNWNNNVFYVGNCLIKANSKISGEYVIEDNTIVIAEEAFNNCDSLTSVIIPDSVTTIGDSAFEDCTSLTSVTIGDSVTSIGDYAFYGCDRLTSISIGNGVKSIGEHAFDYTAYYYDANNWENNVLYIGCYLIKANKSISGDYVVKNGTNAIAECAFKNCDKLTSISIPQTVKAIGDYAFYYCNALTGVYITNLSKWCSINFPGYYSNPLYYAKNLYINGRLATDIVISDTVDKIGSFAFCKCTSLKSVVIGKNVTHIGESAFDYCGEITSFTFGENVESIDAWAFAECNKLESIYITNMSAWCDIEFKHTIANPLVYADNLYLNGQLVTELVIPDSVTVIKKYSFRNYDKLKSVEIPNTVTIIDEYAFDTCDSLSSIMISSGLTSINKSAFNRCGKITDVYYSGTEEQWVGISINEYNEPLLNATIHFNSCLYNENYQHSYKPYETQPTCTSQGYTIYTCSACSDTYTGDYVDALGHTDGDVVEENYVAPTCSATGSKENVTYCTVCNTETSRETITIPALGHTEKEIPAVAPTCTDTGLTTGVKCSVCDEVLEPQQEVPPLGHDIITDYAVSPNCTNIGLTAGEHCSRCDYKVEQTVVDALGHNYDSVITAPTCTEQGYTTYTCSSCGDIYTSDYVDALGHTDGDVVEENYIVPTCTETGSKDNVTYCTVCDAETSRKEIIIDATGHTEEEIPAVAPTCTENGLTAGVKCSVCGEILTAQQEILANGHKYESVVTAPTCTEQGYTTYTCACGDSYVDDYTDSLGHDFENGTCTECSATDPDYFTFEIQNPSRTTIRCNDGIKLHTSITGNLPEGSRIEWSKNNSNFNANVSDSGNEITIISKNNGYTTFTATVYDADNNAIAQDTIEMYSKSGFFDKIGGFFRSLFGTTKIYDN